MPAEDCDVIVVGAGMVGAVLVQMLADAGFSVVVFERDGLITDWDSGEHDLRVSAINLSSERVLTALDIWSDVCGRRASPYERMYVWDAGSTGKIEFDCADYGLTHLGTIVENNLISFLLHQKIQASRNVTVIDNVELDAIDQGEKKVAVRWGDSRSVRGKVLVGADGAGSWVRESLGMSVNQASYDQLGIVAQVSTEENHRQTAWQRFLSTGPLAFLPLSNADCSIVWSCEQQLAGELMALGDSKFSQRLTESFACKLGKVTCTGPRKSFLLASASVPHYIDNRSVLIGDAAHVVHPLAGQGVNLGLTDAAVLAEVLSDARNNNKDIGHRLTLRRYERWRKGDNLLMGSALTGMKNLFGTKINPVATLRGVGLDMVDEFGPLKRLFASKAMGISGDLPDIMRVNTG